MARVRRAYPVLLAICLLLASGARGAEALRASAPGSQPRPAGLAALWQASEEMPESFRLVAENRHFRLFADEATLAFKVVDKRSGYIWHSNLDEAGPDDKLNKTWTAFARSGISIDYLDQKAISKRASITNAERSIDVKPIDQGFEASVRFLDASIVIGVQVRLEDSGVRVDVPFDSIREEDSAFKLGVLYVYPFLGATRQDEVPGYMFIPDGAGSLIPFAATTKAKNMFYSRFYGSDLGMLGTLPWNATVVRPYKMSIPVIGMVHGERQNAFIAIVEKGASYGEIQAHPAGVVTNFNFLCTAYVYNESYFQATNRAGAGVTVLQHDTNAFDIRIHYRFVTGEDSDYVGMARSYQLYLLEKGVLERGPVPGGDIGIRLEFLGSEKERVLLWQRSIPMTTVKQMADILDDLEVKNPEVIYYGWQPLGASSMVPKSLRLERRLGRAEQLRELAEKVAAAGGSFHLYLDPQAALWKEGGYSPGRDLAMSITNANLLGYNRGHLNYYFNLEALRGRFPSLRRDVLSKLGAGLALDGLGSVLYSDFKSGHFLNREDAIEAYRSLLAEDRAGTSFYMPNDYMFGFADAYYDIPLTNSGYTYTSGAVPFLQIVLAGYIPTYGPALNFSSNLRQDLLRLADFGVYPSYFLSHEVTAKILRTDSNWIYSSSYQQWGQEIEQTYQWLNNLLGPVKGQPILSRQALREDVFATTYGNGMQVIVNYGDAPFSLDGAVVNGRDAVVREVSP